MNDRLFDSGTPTRYEPAASLTLREIQAMTQPELLDTFPGIPAAFTQLRDWAMSDEAQMERAS